jgi:hypothetical protein
VPSRERSNRYADDKKGIRRSSADKTAGDPGFPLEIPPKLIGAPLALVGGILAVRYHAAAGRANAWRNSQDLDRALVAVGLIWRWAAVTVVALFALPLIILGIGVMTGAWR